MGPWHASELVSFLIRLRTYQHPGTLYYITLYYIIFLCICVYEYTCNLGFEIYNCCMVFSNETFVLCTLSYDFISATKRIVVRFEWQRDAGDNNLCLFKRLDARSRQKCIHCVFNIYVMTWLIICRNNKLLCCSRLYKCYGWTWLWTLWLLWPWQLNCPHLISCWGSHMDVRNH